MLPYYTIRSPAYLKDYPVNAEEVLRFAESFVLDGSKKHRVTLRVTPPRLNERLAIQKGLFLFPCDISESFETNLSRTFGFSFNTLDSSNAIRLTRNKLKKQYATKPLELGVVKINLPRRIHKDALAGLYSMNIDAASLFPGLDGFARSLNHIHPDTYRANVAWKKSMDSFSQSDNHPMG